MEAILHGCLTWNQSIGPDVDLHMSRSILHGYQFKMGEVKSSVKRYTAASPLSRETALNELRVTGFSNSMKRSPGLHCSTNIDLTLIFLHGEFTVYRKTVISSWQGS